MRCAYSLCPRNICEANNRGASGSARRDSGLALADGVRFASATPRHEVKPSVASLAMLVFLIVLFAVLFIVFGVLGYGALQDGLRLLYSGISVICFIWVLILGLRLANQSDAPVPQPQAAIDTPKIETAEPVKAEPVPPKPPPVAVPATLPQLAEKGTSFHLEPRQSSPIFRIPNGKTRARFGLRRRVDGLLGGSREAHVRPARLHDLRHGRRQPVRRVRCGGRCRDR